MIWEPLMYTMCRGSRTCDDVQHIKITTRSIMSTCGSDRFSLSFSWYDIISNIDIRGSRSDVRWVTVEESV